MCCLGLRFFFSEWSTNIVEWSTNIGGIRPTCECFDKCSTHISDIRPAFEKVFQEVFQAGFLLLVIGQVVRRGGSVPPNSVGRQDTHMAITNKIVNEGLRPTLPSSLFAVGFRSSLWLMLPVCLDVSLVAGFPDNSSKPPVDREISMVPASPETFSSNPSTVLTAPRLRKRDFVDDLRIEAPSREPFRSWAWPLMWVVNDLPCPPAVSTLLAGRGGLPRLAQSWQCRNCTSPTEAINQKTSPR